MESPGLVAAGEGSKKQKPWILGVHVGWEHIASGTISARREGSLRDGGHEEDEQQGQPGG